MSKNTGWSVAGASDEQMEATKARIRQGLRNMVRIGRYAQAVLDELDEKGYYNGRILGVNYDTDKWSRYRYTGTDQLYKRMLLRDDGQLRGESPNPLELTLDVQTGSGSTSPVRIIGPAIRIHKPSEHRVVSGDTYFGMLRFNKTGTVFEINKMIRVRKTKIPGGEEKEAVIRQLAANLVVNETRAQTSSTYQDLLRSHYAKLIEETGTYERLWKSLMEIETVLSVEKA